MASKKGRAPAFQLYASDFLGDPKVQVMTHEEVGVYLRLLCYSWLEDGLPTDHKVLAKFLHATPRKFKSLWEAVGPCWYEDGDRYRQKRQEAVREAQRQHRLKSSEGGKKSAENRRAGRCLTATPLALLVALLVALWCTPKANTPSPSPSPASSPVRQSNQLQFLGDLVPEAPAVGRTDGGEKRGRNQA